MNFANTPLVTRDPKSLRVHPRLKQPELSDSSSDFLAICASVQEHGIREPILITADGLIADGRHRWRVAKRLALTSVPVVVIPEENVSTVITDSLLSRRHLTKSQMAYALAPNLDQAFEEAQKRRALNASKNVRHSAPYDSTPEAFAARMGLSIRTLRQARELHSLFENVSKRLIEGRETTFREHFEPKIMKSGDAENEKPMGLGAALAGVKQILAQEAKGLPHPGGRPAAGERQRELLTRAWADLANRAPYLAEFDPDTKKRAIADMGDYLEKIPPDVLRPIVRKMQAILKKHQRSKS